MKKKTAKEPRKLLYSFSKGDLVDALLEGTAKRENKYKSTVLEDIILETLLPQDEEARHVIENFLYDENGGIGRTLEALFDINSAGVYWKSKHDNFEEILSFAKRESALYNQTILTGKEKELPHLKSQFAKLIEKLSDERLREFAKEIYEELDEEPQFTRLVNIYQIIQDDWGNLKGWSITYRLLAIMARVEKGNWRDTLEVKAELCDILRRTSAEWTTKTNQLS